MRTLALLTALSLGPAAGAQISVSTDAPVRGQPVEVTFDVPTDELVVTYRPNSGIAVEETIAVGGATSATWTPSRAGVVALATPDGASTNVSVRFARTPISGVVILIAAGLVLFGGAAFAMRALLAAPEAGVGSAQWPDT